MKKKIFDFKKQLSIGQKGENLFVATYKYLNPIKSEEDLSYDFKISGNKKVELKLDTYINAKNFFMEKYSSFEDKKVGGPWRGKIDYFVYLFINEKTFYWFVQKDLLKFLDEYIKGKEGKMVKNKGYTTLGYTVAKKILIEKCYKIDKL